MLAEFERKTIKSQEIHGKTYNVTPGISDAFSYDIPVGVAIQMNYIPSGKTLAKYATICATLIE